MIKKAILTAAMVALATPVLAQGADVGAGEYSETARTQANLTPWRSAPRFARAPVGSQNPDVGAGEYGETARTQANLTPWCSPMTQSYAYAPSQAYGPGQAYGPFGYGIAPGSVYQNGEKIGQDPDAGVRLQLRRDAMLGDPALVSVPNRGYQM